MSAPVINVREPSGGNVGCVSARVRGAEICFAVGRPHGRWHICINQVLFNAAKLPEQPIYVSGQREDAERMVRLLASLYAAATVPR